MPFTKAGIHLFFPQLGVKSQGKLGSTALAGKQYRRRTTLISKTVEKIATNHFAVFPKSNFANAQFMNMKRFLNLYI